MTELQSRWRKAKSEKRIAKGERRKAKGENMADWVHTFKGAVLASEYDFASHMNSHMYVSRFDQATWFLLHAIGMTPASMKQKNLRVAIIRQNYQFLEELRGGELVEIKSGFLTVGGKYFRFLHQMYDYETGKMVATCDSVAVQASLGSGKSVPMTEALQEEARWTRRFASVIGCRKKLEKQIPRGLNFTPTSAKTVLVGDGSPARDHKN
jgi:acyl-CoA thioester hydrolase